MKRRVLFRADASKSTGYGHFVRSLALAWYLKDSFECFFASFNLDTPLKLPSKSQFQQILDVCTPLKLQGDNIEEYNKRFLDEIQNTDIVVLDNYYYTTEYQKKIKDKGCKLVCIDDIHNRHMVCDLLITVSPLEKNNFSVERDTIFLGGIEYGFLREPFFQKQPIRNIERKIQDVVIAMGGADAYNLTDKIAAIVHDIMPQSKINIIAGETVNISRFTNTFAEVHRNQNATQIVKLMDNADVGVFPASTICIEAMSRSLPIIAGYYAENQKEFYDYGVQHKYFSAIGCLFEKAETLASRLENILQNNRPSPTRIDFYYRKEETIKRFIELSKI